MEEEVPIVVQSTFSFYIPGNEWRTEVVGAKAFKGQGKRAVKRKVWLDRFSEALEIANPYCLLDRGPALGPLKMRASEEESKYDYAYTRVGCRRQTVDKVPCDVVYRICLRHAPAEDAEEVEFVVTQLSGNPVHNHRDPNLPTDFFRSNVTATQRKEIKTTLKDCNMSLKEVAQKYSREAVRAGAIETGNLSKAPTLNAFRHMDREMRAETRLGEEWWSELELWEAGLEEDELEALEAEGKKPRSNHLLGFVQEIIHQPFAPLCFTDEGVRLAATIMNKPKSIVFSDATGNVVKQGKGEMMVYAYAQLLRSETKAELNLGAPVNLFLSKKHDTERLRHGIGLFHAEAQKKIAGDYLHPTESVTDYSLALIRATCLVYNAMRLWEYIQWSYEVIHGRKLTGEIESKTVILVCGFHGIRLFPLPKGRSVATWRRNSELRKLLALMIMAESLVRLAAILALLAFILNSEFYTKAVEDAINDVKAMAEVSSEMLEELGALEQEDEGEGDDGDYWLGGECDESQRLARYCSNLAEEQGTDYVSTTQRARSPYFRALSHAGRPRSSPRRRRRRHGPDAQPLPPPLPIHLHPRKLDSPCPSPLRDIQGPSPLRDGLPGWERHLRAHRAQIHQRRGECVRRPEETRDRAKAVSDQCRQRDSRPSHSSRAPVQCPREPVQRVPRPEAEEDDGHRPPLLHQHPKGPKC